MAEARQLFLVAYRGVRIQYEDRGKRLLIYLDGRGFNSEEDLSVGEVEDDWRNPSPPGELQRRAEAWAKIIIDEGLALWGFERKEGSSG